MTSTWAMTLLWSVVTLLSYVVALRLFTLGRQKVLLHPLLLSSVLVYVLLLLSQTSIPTYLASAGWLESLLGPAVVALAIPLRNQMAHLRQLGARLLLPVLVGGILAPLSAFALLFWAAVPANISLAMLTKSITTPLAMDTTTVIGGLPGVAAVFVIVTGMVGAVCATTVFRLGSITQEEAKGLGLGTAAHAIGTAQGFQISEKVGTFATVALCVNGVATALLLPTLVGLLH